MGRAEMQKLIGMACTDPLFRSALVQDAETAARSAGLELTPAEIDMVRKLKPADIDEFAAAFVARFGSDRAAY